MGRPPTSFRRPDVFTDGNMKLGEKVFTFSLPAIDTCPGSSELCRSVCYVMRRQSFFMMPGVKESYWDNLKLSKRDDFADIAIEILNRNKKPRPVRLHVSGDFYDEVYAEKWLKVMTAIPQLKFWFYTRSWSVSAIRKVLERMAALPNVYPWYSYDQETGAPKGKRHPRIRLAYMRVAGDDIPTKEPDLFFREHQLRRTVEKHVEGTLVCPAENGATGHVQCTTCRICLTTVDEEPTKRTKGRFALPVV